VDRGRSIKPVLPGQAVPGAFASNANRRRSGAALKLTIASDHVSSGNDLTQGTRIANAEGQTVLLRQYARRVDASLRPFLAGRETPLILAATEPLGPIFRTVCTYPALAAEGISASPDSLSDNELADAARSVLNGLYAAQVVAARELFQTRLGQRRATTGVGEAARAATKGAVEVLLVDIDHSLPGTVGDLEGEVSLASAPSPASYDVIDEIAGRCIVTGRGSWAYTGRIFPRARNWRQPCAIRSEENRPFFRVAG
jgi:hypothetical protein